MKTAYTLVLLTILIGLLGGCAHDMLSPRTEMKNPETARTECVAHAGVMFGVDYVMPGVVDENGNCVVLHDTAARIIHDEATYALLKGKVLETNATDCTIRIADQDNDGRVDNYDLIDRSGDIVLGYFRDLETGNVYSRCTLPGRVADGIDVRLEDRDFLDKFNAVLENPQEHGFQVVSN